MRGLRYGKSGYRQSTEELVLLDSFNSDHSRTLVAVASRICYLMTYDSNRTEDLRSTYYAMYPINTAFEHG